MGDLPTIGILAGGGPLPGQVAAAVKAMGQSVFIVAFQDFADPKIVSAWPHEFVRLAAAGRILTLLRENNCKDIVLIGPVRRPSWKNLRPDVEGARILARIGKAIFAGDDGLLAALVRVLSEEGFTVRGAHEFLEPATKGVLGKIVPDQQAFQDISRGIEVVQALGQLDIGQSCVVQNGLVLAVEAMEGTDAMLQRAGMCKQPGIGGVLIKQVKPGQERRADMPTIGPKTIEFASKASLRGVAFEAGGTLLVDQAETIRLADQMGLFLYGFNPDSFRSSN